MHVAITQSLGAFLGCRRLLNSQLGENRRSAELWPQETPSTKDPQELTAYLPFTWAGSETWSRWCLRGPTAITCSLTFLELASFPSTPHSLTCYWCFLGTSQFNCFHVIVSILRFWKIHLRQRHFPEKFQCVIFTSKLCLEPKQKTMTFTFLQVTMFGIKNSDKNLMIFFQKNIHMHLHTTCCIYFQRSPTSLKPYVWFPWEISGPR